MELYNKNEEKIIVTLPAYNEENYIAKVILRCLKLADEVVVVDDGSDDATSHIADALGAIVIKHDINKGYGAALKTCFDIAKKRMADIMIILDADGQHDPTDINKLVECVRNGSDIVIGSRFISIDGNNNDNSKAYRIPTYRKIGIKILDLMTIYAGSEKTSDSQSGFRAYSRKAIEQLRINGDGMSAGSEILIQAKEKGLKISEAPIVCRYDQGESTQNPISHALGIITNIGIGMIYKRPLLYFSNIGIIFLAMGGGIGIWSIQRYLDYNKLPFGPSIVMLLFLIFGSLMIFSGLILHGMQRLIKEIKEEKNHE